MSEQMRDPHPWVNQVSWYSCGGNMFVGEMQPQPKTGEFDSVLSITTDPGSVDDNIRHRHIQLIQPGAFNLDPDHTQLSLAVDWCEEQFRADRSVLVRSDTGRVLPCLVVAATFVRLGGTFTDGVLCARRGRPQARDEWFLQQLITWDDDRSVR